ncbi:porin family protein [Riemerella columbipharyngis]|uniref:Outer membrane protein beta-barrel domain-containing protein n=1 Tax=Riemerella columbipharyngis TaxID=1071918 RepID=A0A1G6ZTD6_9FLAO|nr:PorT family protein [Riemerella columbipharyngis]SDE05791.1 hypothetical protein SAMN05421544_102201 [Riemerella columbipharyngis]
MKTKLFSVILGMAALGSFAQNTSSYESQMKSYTQKIDSITMSEKSKMNKELDSLEHTAKIQNLPKDSVFTIKHRIATKYKKNINEKISVQRTELDKLTKVRVKDIIMGKNDTIKKKDISLVIGGWNISFKPQPPKATKDFTKYLSKDGWELTYSFLNLVNTTGNLNPFPDNSQMRTGNSHSFQLTRYWKKQVGSFSSPLFVRFGLGFRSDTYMPKRPMVFVEDQNQIILKDFTLGSLKRSKFRNNYLVIPIELKYYLSPTYETFDGVRYIKPNKSTFSISAGIYAGVKLRSIIKVKYYDDNGKFKKYTNKVDNGVNPFLFGAKLGLSYKNLTFFIEKDFTPIFNKNALIPNKNAVQIGVVLVGLN